MARPIRIEYKGVFYDVTSRGNDRKKIFLSQTDYKKSIADPVLFLERICNV